MKSFFIGIALLCLCASASAQALWRGVPAGASPAEVQALIPEALPAPAELLARDGRALLAIPRFELAGADFAVSFLFERERLTGVLLQADAGSAEKARDVAQNLTASLRARYGLELSSKSRKDALTVAIDRQWSYRRTGVRLQVLEGRTVSLRYGVEVPRQSDRL
jgi:hypothetical protein